MIETSANHKKLVGNVCLHRNLAVERRFLRRNLRHILDSHENLLKHPDSNDSPAKDMIANEKRTSGWDFPTKQMLEDLMNGRKPVLQLKKLQIRQPGSTANIETLWADSNSNGDASSWLPVPESKLRLPCQVGITVLDTRTSKQRAYVDSRPATIKQRQHGELYPHFDIELDRPFLIELDKLFVVVETGSSENGTRRWKRTVTETYTLEISIQCQDSDDTAELLSRIEGKKASNYRNAPGNEGVLRATWENLPECPPAGHLMTLKRGECSSENINKIQAHLLSTYDAIAKGHKSLEPDYKLEVAMGWERRRDSPLERYNKISFEKNTSSRQLPTPSASEDLDKTSKRHVIVYNYHDGIYTRTTKVEGLFCPICPNGREHLSFDRLRLHLLTYHDHFKFESEQTTEGDESDIVRHSVKISIRSQKDAADDNPEINWVAPQRPFSVSAHLRGEDNWAPYNRPKPGKRRGRPLGDKERNTGSLREPQPARKCPAPGEVEDLPERRTKKRLVPNVPSVSFYRTSSKKLIEPGEDVEESDEGVDESWLAQNQSRALEDVGITGAAKEFTKAFNQHLAREQSNSAILAREGLVRFTRKYHVELQSVEWQLHFKAKLKQLRSAGIISEQLVEYCLGKVHAASEARPSGLEAEHTIGAGMDRGTPSGPNGLSGHENGHATARERKQWNGGQFTSPPATKGKNAMTNGVTMMQNGHLHDHTAETNGEGATTQAIASNRGKAVCLCGKSARDARAGIACADPVSLR
ncbi:hypothetical protein LTR37_018200 [Vermiconidia calcicola]|uniref:Uncharacterized protein n=1 Tax=Vermiconidia calcicola TaxID=1690605 RepID=A0ACC3MJC8_9PEZI|nr:hypothetical protein LTR37_018200 [Vermiconidia calcicola]